MKSFQAFWVIFKGLLEVMWNLIKMLYTVKYFNILTIGITIIAVGIIGFRLIKRRI